LVLGLGLVAGPLGAADGKDAAVPDDDYPKVVEHQVKVLTDTLKGLQDAKDMTEKKKLTEKARCTAVMLAAVAQDNLGGKDAGQRAGLRDAALEVAGLLKTGKVDDAAKKAADLKNAKPAGAKAEKVKLTEAHINLTELMSQFRLAKAGGQGI